MSKNNILPGLILLAALVMLFLGGDIANLAYLVLAYYALLGRAQIIHALALLWFFSTINPGIASEATYASSLRYLPIFSSIISIVLCNKNSSDSASTSVSWPSLAIIALGTFMLIHSMLFSLMPDVSILKAISWVALMLVLLSAWGGLNYQARILLEKQLFGGLLLLMLISLPLAFTEIGYLTNGHGFQGLMNQPQLFGIFLAVLGSWLIGRLVVSDRNRLIYMAILGLNLLLIVMSEARTAGFALLLGAACAAIIFYSRSIKSLIKLFFVFTILMGIALTQLDTLKAFAFKRDSIIDATEIIAASRGILIYPMIDNILERPVTGIGFGVASVESSRVIDRDNLLGIPSSAPVEKGLALLAVLEELGVPGLLLVILWFWMIARRAIKRGFPVFVVILTLLFTNLGEATLFSAGGGLLSLICIAWGITGQVGMWKKQID